MNAASAKTAEKLLADLFKIIVAEAKSNPAFAEKVATTLGGKSPPAATRAKPKRFDPHGFSLVAAYRSDGEDAFRSRVMKLTVAELKEMAKAQLSIDPSVFKGRASKAAIADAMVVAIEKRIKDRRSAAS